jgi:hypothetical protein
MRKLILLFSLWSILTLSAFSQVTLNVEDVTICDGETTVDVPITIDQYSGVITGIQFELQWDAAGLDLASLDDVISPINGQSPVGNISGNSVGLSLALFSAPTVNAGDTVMIFTFQVVGSAGGTYAVDFVPSGSPSPEVSDGNFSPITPITLNGGVVNIFGLSPVLQGCPSDVTVNTDPGQCGAVVSWTEPTVFDCDENDNAPVVNFTPGSFFAPGLTTVTYNVSDGDGNSDICFFNITVIDNEAPSITNCQGDTSILIIPGQQGDIAGSILEPTTNDNCSVQSLEYAFTGATIASGTFDPNIDYSFNTGMTDVTFTVTDPTGATASCSFVVTVEETDTDAFLLDIEDVVADCGPDQVAIPIVTLGADTLTSMQFAIEWGTGLTFNGQFENPLNIPGNPVFGINPDYLNISFSFSGGTFVFEPGDTLIVLIFDVSAVPGDVIPLDIYTGPGALSAEASDPSFLPVPINIFPGSVTLDFDDPPMITCPADTIVDCGTSLDTSATGMPIAIDDCDPNPAITFIDSDSLICGDSKKITRTFTATDTAGLFSTCVQIITVQDTTPPVALCQDITIQLDGSGSAMITPADVDNGSNDECGDVTLGLSQTDFDCTQVGDNPVTLTVEDPCGNQDTCIATVTVQDTLPPTAVCQSLFLYLDANGDASITPEDIDDGSSDNCGTVNLISVTPSAFTCDNVGPNSVTLLVEDGEGNQDSCNSIVTVLDTISPVMACQDVTVYLDAAGSASITTEDVDNGITDNCGDFTTVSLTPNTFACEDVFNTNNVTLTVEDASGNTAVPAI